MPLLPGEGMKVMLASTECEWRAGRKSESIVPPVRAFRKNR